MQITEITIHPTNEDLVKAYVSIVFDNCFMVGEIRVMQGPTGLFISFPAKKQRDGTYWDIAFPANAETRRMIEQAHTGGVREGRCRRRFTSNRKKVSIKRHERERVCEIKFRLRSQFRPESLLNKVDP